MKSSQDKFSPKNGFMAHLNSSPDGDSPRYDDSLVLMRFLLSSFKDNNEMGIAYEAILQICFRVYHWNVEKTIGVMNELETALKNRLVKVRLGELELEK